MKIASVEAIPFAIPYRKPLRFASGEVHVADHVLVRMHTDDGVVGVAEVPPRPYTYGETQESIVTVIDKIFAPAIVGLSALDREVVHAHMGRTVGNPAAKAAVDMALWDAVGRTLDLPVTRLLGGWTDRMRVAHIVGFAPDAEMVAEAEHIRDRYGITTFKIKIGRRPVEIDVRACQALRNALGPDVELYVDGNRGWSASEAAYALRAMADLDLTLAEELCPAEDILGRRWLVARTPIPTVADESATTPGDVTREVLGGSANMISIKTARTGFTTSQQILHQCQGLGVEIVMGSQIDAQIGTASTIAFGAAHRHSARRPAELSAYLDMADDLLTDPLMINGGELAVPPGPGIGIDVDPDKLTRYRLDRSATHTAREESTMTALSDARQTAAASGRAATASFTRKERSAAPVDTARVNAIASDALAALHDVLRKHEVTYAEYDALKAWLIRLGEDGEWPLFLDLFMEHVVEGVANANRQGAVGTVEGPFYVPGAPESTGETTVAMREGEAGTPLLFHGTVTELDGTPIDGALVELWQADAEGCYSQFAPGIPPWNLRGAIRTGADGRYAFHTIEPAPYQVPTDGACGALISAAGWHPWRPAHLHVKASAAGKQLLTTQLYFNGGRYLDSDIAHAVKPELILNVVPGASAPGVQVTYDFALDPA
jgi:catechol 1,2-dioxygenase